MSGGGGGGSKSSSQERGQSSQVTQVTLPPWVDEASQGNYRFAQDIAARPYQPYGGELISNWSPYSKEAFNLLSNNTGIYQPAYDQALGATAGLLGWGGPADVQSRWLGAGSVGQGDISQFLNPWTAEVEKNAIFNAERSGQQAQRQLEADATAAKAFGGSRQALQQAVQGAETSRGIGDLSAQLRQAGYSQAQQAMAQDYQRQAGNFDRSLSADTASLDAWIRAQQSNQQTGLGAQQLRLNAAKQMGDIAGQGQNAILQDYFALLDAGGRQEGKVEQILGDRYNRFQEERDYPLQQLNVLLASLGMSPYGRTETTNKTEMGSSSSQSKSGGGIDIGSGLMGGLSLLKGLGAFSDRSAKTDIEKVGKHPQLGVPLYAYRYKGDPKSYPKVVGPMAQDIEKRQPSAVKKVGGKRVIDLSRLRAA